MTTSRVFLGLSDVAGYFTALESGLRSLGVDARFHNLSANPLSYGKRGAVGAGQLLRLRYAPRDTWRYRAWNALIRLNKLIRRLRAAALFPQALLRYDVFVLGGHETFLGGLDLRIMRRLGKIVIVVFTGSDHRPPYLSAIGQREHGTSRSLAAETRRIRARIQRAERWSSAIIALPESAQLHRRRFVDLLAIGIAFVPPRNASKPVLGEAQGFHPVRILHCPTDPEAKGTPIVRSAIQRCLERGLTVDYRELVGRPHSEVLDALAWCDLVVDEVFSDTPMGKFATEAAFYGKAVIVGGYSAAGYASRPGCGPPATSYFCLPDEIEEAIWLLSSEPNRRHEIGSRAQAFVTSQWTATDVARRMMRVARGSIPPEWTVRPSSLQYIYGWGMDKTRLGEGVGRFVEEQGPDALCLPTDSALLAALLGFAATSREAAGQPQKMTPTDGAG